MQTVCLESSIQEVQLRNLVEPSIQLNSFVKFKGNASYVAKRVGIERVQVSRKIILHLTIDNTE